MMLTTLFQKRNYWCIDFTDCTFEIFYSKKGTTYQGQWDGWYGPSGRRGQSYNYDLLYNSVTAKALTSVGMSLPNKKIIGQWFFSFEIVVFFNHKFFICTQCKNL